MSDAPSDPFAVLGVRRDASLEDLRSARRRLARELHPDLSGAAGDPAAMQRVNEAFDRAVGHVTGRRPLWAPGPAGRAPASPTAGSPATAGADAAASNPFRRRRAPVPPHRRFRGVEHDAPSFTIDALPAEAFEALLVVASWIGELIDDDPPYVLECVLVEPGPAWCRLELVPDAGGSTVSLMVAPADGVAAHERVTAEEVRDVWVEQLNRLGRPLP